MLTDETAEMVKGATGLSDEEIAKLGPGAVKLFNSVPKTIQFQTVAECIKSENCFAQAQVGDVLVFDPFLNPEKSTGVMCPRALLPIMVQINSIWELSAEAADSGKEEPAEIVFSNVRCLDPGKDGGGIGGVVYQLRIEKRDT